MKEEVKVEIDRFSKEELNKLTDKIVDAFFAVHKTRGPGLNEAIYEACLTKELELQGIPYKRQVRYPIEYKGHSLNRYCIIDLIVDDRVIVELKAVGEFIPLHEAQLLTYLKLTNLRIGYLVNFNVVLMKNGIKRMINGY
jgi:GxxExxY protein